jgi:hypothetical protein
MGCAIYGPCGLHASFECASPLVDTGYAKSEDPMGRVLVSRVEVVFAEVLIAFWALARSGFQSPDEI